MRIDWRPAAARDYQSLLEYLAERSPQAATTIARRITRTIDNLSRFPHLGRPGQLEDTREIAVPRTSYVVVYRVIGDYVQILRVRHGAQRWPAE